MEKHYTTEKRVIRTESQGCLDSLPSAAFTPHHTLHRDLHRAEPPKHILLRCSLSESIQHMRFTQQCMKWIIFLVIFKLQHWFILLGGGGEAVHWLRKRCPQSHSIHIPGLLHWDLIGCWSYPTGIDSKAGWAISHGEMNSGSAPASLKWSACL